MLPLIGMVEVPAVAFVHQPPRPGMKNYTSVLYHDLAMTPSKESPAFQVIKKCGRADANARTPRPLYF